MIGLDLGKGSKQIVLGVTVQRTATKGQLTACRVRLLTAVERGAIVRLYRDEDRVRAHLKLKWETATLKHIKEVLNEAK